MGAVGRLAPRGSRRRAVARRVVRPVRGAVGVVARGVVVGGRRRKPPGRVGPELSVEEQELRSSWAAHSLANLDSYLVRGYQDPRINVQSILVRHYLIRRLFGEEFDQVMRQELLFAVEANEAIRVRAAQLGVDMRVGMDPGRREAIESVCEVIADSQDTFQQRWQQLLDGRTARRLTVLELACGSANDYRFFDSYGLARFLDYTGIDLNPKNITNAGRRFPGVRFQVASVLQLPYPPASFDYVLAFDIFEHLSLEAMEQALGEATRVTRRGLLVAFFIMTDRDQHKQQEKKRERYHWNVLSAGRIRAQARQDFAVVELIHIGSYLADKIGAAAYYNPNAWSLFADRRRWTRRQPFQFHWRVASAAAAARLRKAVTPRRG